jgi:hypothetical protein
MALHLQLSVISSLCGSLCYCKMLSTNVFHSDLGVWRRLLIDIGECVGYHHFIYVHCPIHPSRLYFLTSVTFISYQIIQKNH